jgi:hypothetical protein
MQGLKGGGGEMVTEVMDNSKASGLARGWAFIGGEQRMIAGGDQSI